MRLRVSVCFQHLKENGSVGSSDVVTTPIPPEVSFGLPLKQFQKITLNYYTKNPPPPQTTFNPPSLASWEPNSPGFSTERELSPAHKEAVCLLVSC